MPDPQLADKSLLGSYEPPSGFYDELVDRQRRPRPSWKALLKGMDELGAERIEQREEQLNRIIKENGVTYNVYGDTASGHARPWTMDIVPFLLEHRDCALLEPGLDQRARLFNLILRDVYGPQRLLKNGLLPAMLVSGNPRFLRPCHEILPWSHRHVHLYAADLARAPSGNWWVVNDRLDAASGLGYAFENRIISTRVFSELFHQYPVKRLQPFLAQLHRSFEKLAPQGKSDPKIVFLTPGPANETYFEQSYLARLLGYPLVEGADLAVRNNCVYLKTIAGMEQIDVIVRRLDSEYLDPLELKSDSLLGVPGLLGALREQTVAMVNAPGSGVLETTALPAFLPGICQNLLGEELILPSVASWWCGQPLECNYVLKNLENLIIKPTFPSRQKPNYYGPGMSKAALEKLRAAIKHAPEYFCAQETVAQATTPVFREGGLEPRHWLLRSYLIPRDGRFLMMPGGLARISLKSNTVGSISMQAGGESKDTWALSNPNSVEDETPLLDANHTFALKRDTQNVPSRLADNMFWLGRHVERTDGQARILRVVLNAISEEYGSSFHLGLIPIFNAVLDGKQEAALAAASKVRVDLKLANDYIEHLIHDRDSEGSLTVGFERLRRLSTSVKERLSLDAWTILSKLAEDFEPKAEFIYAEVARREHIDRILESVAGFCGLVYENMTRGPGWAFLEIGRRIERCLGLSHLIQSALVEPNLHEESTLNKLLGCSDTILTYRQRYLSTIRVEAVLDLLLRDESNPRSLAFQVEELRKHTSNLPHQRSPRPDEPISRSILELQSSVRLFDVFQLAQADADGRRSALAKALSAFTANAFQLSDCISARYFSVLHLDTRAEEADTL